MPTPAERRRAKLRVDADRMTDAAAAIREQSDTRYASLRPDEADALATLVEVIASTAREDTTNHRDWEAARRVAESVLAPARQPVEPWTPAAVRPGATTGMPVATDAASWRDRAGHA